MAADLQPLENYDLLGLHYPYELSFMSYPEGTFKRCIYHPSFPHSLIGCFHLIIQILFIKGTSYWALQVFGLGMFRYLCPGLDDL